jgi:hypothetical protein
VKLVEAMAVGTGATSAAVHQQPRQHQIPGPTLPAVVRMLITDMNSQSDPFFVCQILDFCENSSEKVSPNSRTFASHVTISIRKKQKQSRISRPHICTCAGAGVRGRSGSGGSGGRPSPHGTSPRYWFRVRLCDMGCV